MPPAWADVYHMVSTNPDEQKGEGTMLEQARYKYMRICGHYYLYRIWRAALKYNLTKDDLNFKMDREAYKAVRLMYRLIGIAYGKTLVMFSDRLGIYRDDVAHIPAGVLVALDTHKNVDSNLIAWCMDSGIEIPACHMNIDRQGALKKLENFRQKARRAAIAYD